MQIQYINVPHKLPEYEEPSRNIVNPHELISSGGKDTREGLLIQMAIYRRALDAPLTLEAVEQLYDNLVKAINALSREFDDLDFSRIEQLEFITQREWPEEPTNLFPDEDEWPEFDLINYDPLQDFADAWQSYCASRADMNLRTAQNPLWRSKLLWRPPEKSAWWPRSEYEPESLNPDIQPPPQPNKADPYNSLDVLIQLAILRRNIDLTAGEDIDDDAPFDVMWQS